jgi:predicted DNA-binding transcriptional regulator AlpA
MEKIKVVEKIDQKELMILLGKGRTALYHLRSRDSTFPKPIDQQPLRWVRSHIMDWLDSHNRCRANT